MSTDLAASLTVCNAPHAPRGTARRPAARLQPGLDGRLYAVHLVGLLVLVELLGAQLVEAALDAPHDRHVARVVGVAQAQADVLDVAQHACRRGSMASHPCCCWPAPLLLDASHWRRAPAGWVFLRMAAKNLVALSGGSPSPVEEATTTTRAGRCWVSSSKPSSSQLSTCTGAPVGCPGTAPLLGASPQQHSRLLHGQPDRGQAPTLAVQPCWDASVPMEIAISCPVPVWEAYSTSRAGLAAACAACLARCALQPSHVNQQTWTSRCPGRRPGRDDKLGMRT